MDRFPRPIPPGWYQIGWSDDFPLGESRPLRYFGRDLVAYRATSGRVVVLDAHCPHMGAHLGFGGAVVGDSIQCPFHGWTWTPDGRNESIPDGSPPNRAQRLGCWTSQENSGLVLVWYHPVRNDPTWTVPELVPSLDGYHQPERGRRMWQVRVHPQFVAENAIDSAHFQFVHRAGSSPVVVDIADNGENLHVSQEIVFGARRAATWLTPEGPTKGSLEIDLWGLALAFTRFAAADEALSLVATTPIDDGLSDYRMSNWVPLSPDADAAAIEAVGRRNAEQFKQAERDFVIWENLSYIERPPLSRTEARAYRQLRTWADRFYRDCDADSQSPAIVP
ncbi:MAG: Rieske 2Fe-2S domain-containing protein [Acidimicrobiia bacterium]